MGDKISDETLKKLWKSRRTMLEVLEDRGYPVSKSEYVSFEDFLKWAGNDDELNVKKSMTIRYKKSPSERIIVVWPHEKKVGTEVISKLSSEMKETRTRKGIIVVDDSISPKAKGDIANLRNVHKIHINVYTLQDSQINIMKHRLVPMHYLCTNEEKEQIIKNYSIDADELPEIKLSDPPIRHIGADKGDLVKIVRESETQPGVKYVTFRIVVSQPTRDLGSMLKIPGLSMPAPPKNCWKS